MVTTLRHHDYVTSRVRHLVREHLVLEATLAAIVRVNPTLLPEIARVRQQVEQQLRDVDLDSSASEGSFSEYEP